MKAPEIDPPVGEPTFVFTDIEASSALWEAVPDAMGRALRAHDTLMYAACAATGGYAVKAEGDAFMIAFAECREAVLFAQTVQQTLAQISWPSDLEMAQRARGVEGPLGLRVRIGIHRGPAEVRSNPLSGRADYFGGAVNLAARLSDMAHGAQTLLSESTLKQSGSPEQCVVVGLGPVAVRGMKQKVLVHQMVAAAWWPITFPALRLGKVAVQDAEGRPVDQASLTNELEGAAFQLLTRAQIERLAGRFVTARFELRALRAIAEWLGSSDLVIEGLLEQATVESNAGEHEAALTLVDEALAQFNEAEESPLHCRALLDQSTLLRFVERFDEARRSGRAALVLSWRVDDLRLTARAHGCLAEIDRLEGEIEQAEAGTRAALEVLTKHGDRESARSLRLQLGMLLVERGDVEAAGILKGLVESFDSMHMPVSAAATRVNLALHYLDLGASEAFFATIEQASQVFEAARHLDHVAACVLNRAYFYLAVDKPSAAWDELWLAADRFPIAFESGLDLEATVLHAWLLYVRGERAGLDGALATLGQAAEDDCSLLGPMVLQLVSLMTHLQRDEFAQAQQFFASHSAPATVTLRTAWRAMGRHCAAE
jgi:class 3 adenylate cyclase/tetratricopeptide (TPR) repeat protein